MLTSAQVIQQLKGEAFVHASAPTRLNSQGSVQGEKADVSPSRAIKAPLKPCSDVFLTAGAPLGNDNASKHHVHQTDTPEFKAWFGDSKVVDKDGKPLVVYHGTDHVLFKKFDEAYGRVKGFWFSENREGAEEYSMLGEEGHAVAGVPGAQFESAKEGRVISAYLSIKNPAREKEYRSAEDQADKEGLEGFENESRAVEILRKKGYDGATYEDMDGPTWIAFHPTQIKSAIGNKGTWSKTNPDITASDPVEQSKRDLLLARLYDLKEKVTAGAPIGNQNASKLINHDEAMRHAEASRDKTLSKDQRISHADSYHAFSPYTKVDRFERRDLHRKAADAHYGAGNRAEFDNHEKVLVDEFNENESKATSSQLSSVEGVPTRYGTVKAGAPAGNQNAAGPHKFASKEQAQEVKALLEDMKKNGTARDGNLRRLEEANEYLGLNKPAEVVTNPDDEEHISRAQGCMDAFHRTEIKPLMEKISITKNKAEKARLNNRLGENKASHEVAGDLFKQHLPAKELEERVKGLLMEQRQRNSDL